MRLSAHFVKTRKDVPADESAKNARLLIQAGFIHKEMAGVYSYLPLGLKVLNKIARVVREEMDRIGGQEILMPALQLKERYERTDRWRDEVVDNWFKTKLANGTELGLGFSHEENLSPIAKEYIVSYRDLPFAAYQIQTKFRNELRSKSGLMRGREFLMKDMYSFSLNQAQHDAFYQQAQTAYNKIYERLGIGDRTFMTFASGGSFSRFSHEFQTLSEAGEDTIYLSRSRQMAVNKEVLNDEVLGELGLTRDELEEVRGIEVGNIFSLGTKFSAPFDLVVTDENGEQHTVIMGCYGIGVSRLMGTIAELLSDDKGLVWPAALAPAAVVIVRLGSGEAVAAEADRLYEALLRQGVDVMYDDREARAGEKFADADLRGIPFRVVVSEKTLESGRYELKGRTEKDVRMVEEGQLVKILVETG